MSGKKHPKSNGESAGSPSVIGSQDLSAPMVAAHADSDHRVGAIAGGVPSAEEAARDEDLRDLFLTEENLIRLAIGHLGGRHPPRRFRNPGRSSQSRSDGSGGTGMHGSQTSRTRRAIAAKLQRELQSRSWTASELAESAQLTIADCRALLSGQGVFSQEVASKLAQALATSKDYWLKDGMD